MNKNIQTLLNSAENLGWKVNVDGDQVEFGKFSPAGQDFSFCMGIASSDEEFLDDLYQVYESYDVSYETYLWLDNEGHGTNGASYDMMDVYNDMKACEENIKDLFDKLSEIYENIEE